MRKELPIEYLLPMLKAYPDLNITQIGVVLLYLGAIRSAMGHEDARSTLRDYIHKEALPEDIVKCLDFLECEILAMRKSKVDVDYWKRGNKGEFRPS